MPTLGIPPSSGNDRGCAMGGGYAMYCVSKTSAMLVSPSTGAITDHCPSAKDSGTYIVLALCGRPLLTCRGWDLNPQLLARQSVSYRDFTAPCKLESA